MRVELLGLEIKKLSAQRAKILDEALQKLLPDELLVLTMRIRGGSYYRDIAQVIGTSHVTAQAMERRALKKLRDHFGERGIYKSADLF